MTTAGSTAACGVYLEAGKTYLLGGSLDAEKNFIPTLNSCASVHEEWQYSGEKSVQELERLRLECNAFHLKQGMEVKPL